MIFMFIYAKITILTEFKELDSAKTTFISTISHELKTPWGANGGGQVSAQTGAAPRAKSAMRRRPGCAAAAEPTP